MLLPPQGALAAVCDLYTYQLALRLLGPQGARWALLVQLLNWFNFYCSVRTFSGSLEVVLFTAALYHWLAPLSQWMLKATIPGKGQQPLLPPW